MPASLWPHGRSEYVAAVGCENPAALLVMLHGLGDGTQNFAALARKMTLPQTAALVLEAPHCLPLGIEGASWFEMFEDDGDFIEGKAGEARRLDSLAQTRGWLDGCIIQLDQAGWDPRDIFFLGFSQGAITAVDYAMRSGRSLGGVVAVSGQLLAEDRLKGLHPSATPILFTHGSKDSQVSAIAAKDMFDRIKGGLESQGHTGPLLWRQFAKNHEMIGSKEEMQVVMEFFAQHLDLFDPSAEDAVGTKSDIYEITNAPNIVSGLRN